VPAASPHRVIRIPDRSDTMRAPIRPILASAAVVMACAGGTGTPLAAQGTVPDLRTEVTVGSEAERYLRMLQVAGDVPLYPWSVRGFSPAEVDRLVPGDVDHPWASRLPPAGDSASRLVRLVRPRLELGFNSAFPQGTNDGPVWAGRGLTAVATAGAQLRAGPLSVRLEPLVFWSQNQSFPLVDGWRADPLRFRDPRSPSNIDLPQRPGNGSFARLDPGQSTARLDLLGVALGFSTANQHWGPAQYQPLMLGNNAAGFAHAFLGTSTPWKVGIGRLHGRVVWGSLRQTRYANIPPGHGTRRFGSGITMVFLPWGLDGLELGFSRFHHEFWPAGGLEAHNLQRPLEALFRSDLRLPDEGLLNQLASAHFRWVMPRGGIEIYGEYIREDHNYDLLDFIIEPDRSSGYMLGGRKVWGDGGSRYSFTAEWVDTQPSHLEQASNQSNNVYRHIDLKQGHTAGGQLLGSLAAYGGGGGMLVLERYTPRGRWSVDLTRTRLSSPRGAYEVKYGLNMLNSVGGEVVTFRGGMDWVAALRATVESERHPGEDVFNLSAQLGGRIGF